MLQATVLESTSDLLAARPDIAQLLREDGITDDLTRLVPPRRPGLWAMGHLLSYAGGQPCGLVALYAVSQSPRTLVLGPMAGRLVIGKRRTLAALGVMRHLNSYPEDWDELLIVGGGPESRRFDTGARSGKLARRLIGTKDAIEPVLAISSAATWRGRWRFRSASDITLASHWRMRSWLPALEADIAFSQQQAEHRAKAESIMMRPLAEAQPSRIDGLTAKPRFPSHLRIVSTDDDER